MRNSGVVVIWLMVAVVLMSGSQVLGWTLYNDGGTHDIATTIDDDVWVDWESPGMQTTVNVIAGGRISGQYKLQGFDDSVLNVNGGSIDDELLANDRSQVTVSNGSIDTLIAYDTSQTTVFGGLIRWLRAYDNSYTDFSGGSIGYRLNAWGDSHVDVSGGVVQSVRTYSGSTTHISGGTITGWIESAGSQVRISGGSVGAELRIEGTVTVFGSEFMVDGQPVSYGSIGSILGGDYDNEPSRRLTGTLLSGETIDNDFYVGHSGQLVLVPEPYSLILLVAGAISLLAYTWRRRERCCQ